MTTHNKQSLCHIFRYRDNAVLLRIWSLVHGYFLIIWATCRMFCLFYHSLFGFSWDLFHTA